MTRDHIKPLLFTLGLDPDWGLYAPRLIELAKSHGYGVHILETGAPLGTGTFTSNIVQNENDPGTNPDALASKEVLPEGMKDFGDPYPQPTSGETDQPHAKDEKLVAWPDTIIAQTQMSNFVEDLVNYFREAGLTVAGDWKPDFDLNQLPDYAKSIGADLVALPKVGFPSSLIQGALVRHLESAGLQVELIAEVTEQELEALEADNAQRGAGDATKESTLSGARSQSQASLNSAMSGELPLESVIGQRARSQVTRKDGTVLVPAGEIVTREMLARAQQDHLEGQLLEAVKVDRDSNHLPPDMRDGNTTDSNPSSVPAATSNES